MRYILAILLLLPLALLAQINDDWDAVKVGSTDMSRIYVGDKLVWEKATPITTPQYVNNGGLASTTAATLNVPYPTGADAGDGLILAFKVHATNISAGNPRPPAPNGWTLIGYKEDIGFDYYAAFYYRIATAPLTGSVAITNTYSGINDQVGIIYRYSNVSNADATFANVGSYSTNTFSYDPQTFNGQLDISSLILFSNNTATISGDFTVDSNEADATANSRFVQLSVQGDATQKTVNVTSPASLNLVMSGFKFY